jgi:hypothetical protein
VANKELTQFSEANVAVVGIVRNIEDSIEKDYKRISEALGVFKSQLWFLVESNSSDESISYLDKLSKEIPDLAYVSVTNSIDASKSRTEKMAFARNRYLNEIRDNPLYKDCAYVVICDFNNLNSLISMDALNSCLANSEWDVCTANQKGPYYDIWALRHDLWNPADCWQQLEFLRRYIKYPEKALQMAVLSKMIQIPPNSNWIRVDSAFGGFAIYRREALQFGKYIGVDSEGRPICEHVPLHNALTKEGFKIFINPRLINTKRTDHSQHPRIHRKIFRLLNYPVKKLVRSV